MVQYRAMALSEEHSVLSQDAVNGAREWIDAAAQRWRVQVLARRTRVTEFGTKFIPTRLRRFVEGLPWPYVKPALDYLLSQAPYRGILANGVDFGAAYRPTLTIWQRDSQQAALGAKGAAIGDATYTLIQDLVEADADDVYAVGTSSSCSETVESEYVWDAADVADIPQGSMGVTWQVAQVHRNDDGTFDYALVKRVALTQHAGPVTTEDNAVRKVVVDRWDNVYVDAEGRYCDDGMVPLGIPEPGIDPSGATETQVSVESENPDCTLRLAVRSETHHEEDVRETDEIDLYKQVHETERQAEDSDFDPVLASKAGIGRGVTHRVEKKLRPDGAHDRVDREVTEREVKEAAREVAVGRRGVRVVVQDRNVSKVPEDPTDPGHAVKVEKTPGGLFDVTTTDFTLGDGLKVGETCKTDQFAHTHAVVSAAGSVDLSELDVLLASDGHATYGGGVVRTYETSMDDDGAVTLTSKSDTEQNVPRSEVQRESYVDATVVVRKDYATGKAVPGDDAGTWAPFVKHGAGAAGSSLRYEKTPGGLVTVTEHSVSLPESDITMSKSLKRDSTTEVEEERASLGAEHRNFSLDVPKAAKGVHKESEVTISDRGTYVRRNVTTTEADTLIRKSVENRAKYSSVTTVQNSKETYEMPTDVGTSMDVELTPGNQWRITERSLEPSAVPARAHSERTALQEVDDVVSYGVGEVDDSAAPDAGDGYHYVKDSTMDDLGVVETVLRTVYEIETEVRSETDVHAQYTSTTVVTQSTGKPETTPDKPGQMLEAELMQGGRWRVTERTLDPNPNAAHFRQERTALQTTTDRYSNAVGEIDDSDVEAANGGFYYTKESKMDDLGVVETMIRTVDEETLSEFGVQSSGDVFHTVKNVQKRSVESIEEASALDVDESGVITSGQSEITPGALRSGSVTTDTPHYQHWTDSIETDLYCSDTWYFRNATESQAEQDSRIPAEDKVLTYKTGSVSSSAGSAGGGRITSPVSSYAAGSGAAGSGASWIGGTAPSSVRVSGSKVMNGHGLFDGYYTIEASWDPMTGGKDQDRTNTETVLAKWNYTILGVTYSIGYSPGSNDKEAFSSVHCTKVRKDITETIAAGWAAHASKCFQDKTLIEGSHLTVTPSTGIAHSVVIEKAQTDIDVKDLYGNKTNYNESWSGDAVVYGVT